MNSVLDEIDFDYAASVAERAVGLMSKQHVPPTPNNFEVWFHYSHGSLPQLRKAIDVLIGNKRKFDIATNRDLFTTYVNSNAVDHAFANQLSGQIQTVITHAQDFLKAAASDNRSQIQALGDVSSQVDANADPKPIIARLVGELSKAAIRASAQEANFTKASEEMETIRDRLLTAERHSNTDTLTGLANRRSLDEFLRTSQIEAMERGNPLSVLLIDVDHFKKFNDNYGHQVGDQVLRLIAKVLQERVRERDLAARYGGEELMVILPETNLQTAQEVAERIRRTIAECHITRRTTGEAISSITVSIGVSQFQLGESSETLIERCDRALYLAKRLGRNRTLTENELDSQFAQAV